MAVKSAHSLPDNHCLVFFSRLLFPAMSETRIVAVEPTGRSQLVNVSSEICSEYRYRGHTQTCGGIQGLYLGVYNIAWRIPFQHTEEKVLLPLPL